VHAHTHQEVTQIEDRLHMTLLVFFLCHLLISMSTLGIWCLQEEEVVVGQLRQGRLCFLGFWSILSTDLKSLLFTH
jgi:hypothetical protein